MQKYLTQPKRSGVAFNDLLVRPAGKYGEGLNGYKKRVCSENNLTNAMCNKVRFENTEHFTRTKELTAFSGISFNKLIGNVAYARFCPKCFAGDEVWKIEWELIFYDACPKHKCVLLDKCQNCGQFLSWKRQQFSICDCGAALKSFIAEPCSENQARLSLTILRSINIDRNIKAISHFKIIEHLSIFEIQKLVRLMGRHEDLKENWGSKKTQNQSCLNMSLDLTEATADLFANWPESFYASLKQREEEFHLIKKSNRIKDCFGAQYSSIFSKLFNTNFDFIRRAFSEYIVTNWRAPIAERNKRVRSEMRSNGSWLTSNFACKELGVSPNRLRKMIADGEITGFTEIHTSSGRHRTVVKRSTIPGCKENINKFVDLKACAGLLGLSKKRMQELRLFLFPMADKELEIQRSRWKIDRSQIERILNASQSRSKSFPDERIECPLASVFKYWKWSTKDFSALIEDVIAGKMCPTGKYSRKRGIMAWIFNIADLQSWAAQNKIGIAQNISVPVLAVHLKIKQEVAYFFW